MYERSRQSAYTKQKVEVMGSGGASQRRSLSNDRIEDSVRL